MSALARPANQPNLARLRYRLGTFSDFRYALLDDLPELLPGWRSTPSGRDYATALLELWAYLADILCFYQELIANEAYVGTAARSDSLRRLAELVGYRPSPGSGATTLLAFAATKGRTATVPAGLRVGSQPSGSRPAAIFETSAATTVRSEHNAIALAAEDTVDQFTPIGQPRGGAAAALADALSALPDPALAVSRTVAFRGVGLGLRPSDYVLVLDGPLPRRGTQAPPHANGQLRRLLAVAEDRATRTTTATWAEEPGHRYASGTPQVFGFRVTAAPFGHLAASDAALPAADAKVLDLDAVYDAVTAGARGPSYAVLIDTETTVKTFQTFALADADVVSANRTITRAIAGGGSFPSALTARVTRLRLDHDIHAGSTPGHFKLGSTIVLAGSVELELDDSRPLPERVTGARIVLEGIHPDLVVGQLVIVRGAPLVDDAPGPGRQAESAIVGLAQLDRDNDTTALLLRPPLRNVYARSATAVLANIAAATQGETVRDEVLGSGDGSAWQAFRLRKRPLTYLPAGAGAEEPVTGTLQLTVDGVRWERRTQLLGARAGERVYVTSEDDTGTTTVLFGDTTAHPPSGRDNVRARYRRGLGAPGDLGPDALTKLIDGVPGVRAVANPVATVGAADAERPEEIRANASSNVRTFARAVSVEDYATLARTFPGVAMARATWARGPQAHPEVQLVVAGAARTALPADSTRALRSFLDARRDVNVPLRIVSFTPVYVDVRAVIDVLGAYGRRATLLAALKAMNPRANPDGSLGFFARLGFGQSVHLSAVYAALQSVPGVAKVTLFTLRNPERDPRGTVQDRVAVGPVGLAVIADDPDDPANERGRLVIELGQGGYAD